MFVLRESLLECSFVIVNRALVFIAAVALVLENRFGVDAGYFLVVLIYYGLHVVHTTVADLDVVCLLKRL